MMLSSGVSVGSELGGCDSVVGGFLEDSLTNRCFFFRRASFLTVVISKELFSVKPGVGMSVDGLALDVGGYVIRTAERGFIRR